MRTARLLPYLPAYTAPWGGNCPGVYLPGGVPAQGVYLPKGVYLPRGLPAQGSVPTQVEFLPWGYLPRGVLYHVTYPIMHLMLPVCCLLTNWDQPTVQLLIYCWLVTYVTCKACWDTTTSPPWTEWQTRVKT